MIIKPSLYTLAVCLGTLLIFQRPSFAAPAWSVTPTIGGALVYTRYETDPAWPGKDASDFHPIALGLEAEVSIWDRNAVGLRLISESDGGERSSIPGFMYNWRSQSTLFAFGKRNLWRKGPFDVSALTGLGFASLYTNYEETPLKGKSLDPDRPDDEVHHSAALVFGLSQRVFHRVVGLTINESVQATVHAVAFRIELGVPLGWASR